MVTWCVSQFFWESKTEFPAQMNETPKIMGCVWICPSRRTVSSPFQKLLFLWWSQSPNIDFSSFYMGSFYNIRVVFWSELLQNDHSWVHGIKVEKLSSKTDTQQQQLANVVTHRHAACWVRMTHVGKLIPPFAFNHASSICRKTVNVDELNHENQQSQSTSRNNCRED